MWSILYTAGGQNEYNRDDSGRVSGRHAPVSGRNRRKLRLAQVPRAQGRGQAGGRAARAERVARRAQHPGPRQRRATKLMLPERILSVMNGRVVDMLHLEPG